jgi:hypothetical protein
VFIAVYAYKNESEWFRFYVHHKMASNSYKPSSYFLYHFNRIVEEKPLDPDSKLICIVVTDSNIDNNDIHERIGWQHHIYALEKIRDYIQNQSNDRVVAGYINSEMSHVNESYVAIGNEMVGELPGRWIEIVETKPSVWTTEQVTENLYKTLNDFAVGDVWCLGSSNAINALKNVTPVVVEWVETQDGVSNVVDDVDGSLKIRIPLDLADG